MSDGTMTHCKTALSNLIASERVQRSSNPFQAFADGIHNFVPHYCLDDHTSTWCHHDKVNSDGTPYKSQHGFTCRSQVQAFSILLDKMTAHPEDYVSECGRLTTNTVEGFHGLALVYRDKRTDLSHTHYVCKTNMAICHTNMGPIWKAFCFIEMGVDIPLQAIASILREQQE